MGLLGWREAIKPFALAATLTVSPFSHTTVEELPVDDVGNASLHLRQPTPTATSAAAGLAD